MTFSRRHPERHRTDRIGWVARRRARRNDGIVSTASLVVGVAAASASQGQHFGDRRRGACGGAMSMARWRVCLSPSQADTEKRTSRESA